MLKRKQKKARLISYGFLLLTTPAITAITQDVSPSMIATRHHYNHVKAILFTDTSAIKSIATDSLGLSDANKTTNLLKEPTVHLNSQATKFVKDYVKKNSNSLSKIKERSNNYFTVMNSVFSSYNLPLQLKYLAVIESELNLKAVSHVGAVGLWQLMPSTAKMLGLKVTRKYDERHLCYKSTKAAAKYLNDLYGEFGDWLLVIAAYNSGPGPVYAAIKKSGSRNFWRLQQYLPAETKLHVKRFIGTQYYFEGEGSITTLTKAEAEEHLKAMAKFMETKQAAELVNVSSVDSDNKPIALTR